MSPRAQQQRPRRFAAAAVVAAIRTRLAGCASRRNDVQLPKRQAYKKEHDANEDRPIRLERRQLTIQAPLIPRFSNTKGATQQSEPAVSPPTPGHNCLVAVCMGVAYTMYLGTESV